MYDEDFNEDLADAVREGSLVDCPYVRGLIHCDEDCNNCDDCLDKKTETLKKKIIQYKEVDGYLEQYIDGVFKHRIEKPISIEPFSIKEE